LPEPELAEPVRRLLEAAYLSEDEKRDLRVAHGLETPEDLDTPARRALAAVTRGAWMDAALADPAAPALLRAEALAMLGRFEAALELLGDDTSVPASRLRAEALAGLGRVGEVAAALGPIGAALREGVPPADAPDAALGVALGLSVLGPGDAEGDFQFLIDMLGRAREGPGVLDWRVPMAEAGLLMERGAYQDAGAALERALSLNARAARAWRLVGETAAQNFDFARAELAARRLDELAGEDLPPDAEPGRSIFAAAVMARAKLRQVDPEGALALLDRAAERFPEQRALLALRIAAAHAGFRVERAAELTEAFEKLSPGSALAHLEAGKAMSDRRQYAAAGELLREAARRGPFLPEPWIELGLLEVQSGRDALALEALEKAAALDPFNKRVGNSLTLVRELGGYDTIRTEHFIVRHRPGVDGVLAREMAPLLDEMHGRVTGRERDGIDHVMPRSDDLPNGGKTVIELMPDHRWFSVRITGMPRVHTVAASTGPVIAMEAPRAGPNHLVGPYDWLRVVRHEYVHTVTLSRSNSRLPHWFTEAAAVHLEDAPRDWSTVQLLTRAVETGTLFDLDRINLAFVRPQRPTDRAQAYAQGAWMYGYIVERWGPEAPLKLMDRYGAGDSEAAAFQTVLGVEREEFLNVFTAWAGERLVAWGMRPPAGVPTVRELISRDRAAAGGDAAPGGSDSGPGRETISAWLEEFPEQPELLSLAVRNALAANKGQPAPGMIDLLERLARARPVDPTPHRHLARLRLEAGQYAQAVPHLEFLDVREQYSPAVAAELSRVHARLGGWDRAWASAQRAVRIAPYEGSGREWAATVALKRQDHESARWHLWALTQIEPDRPEHAERLAALEKLSGRRDPAPAR
jgi:tetratricopeptide (TPR) repeat protein